MENKFEQDPTKEQTPIPNALDVIKINGRWAQFTGFKSIKYLDNQESEQIYDFNEYEFFPLPNYLHVKDLIINNDINEEELQSVHWGSEQDEYPHLRGEVKIFGEYRKIKQSN